MQGSTRCWFGEDLGSQTSMLISPEQWRERYKPRHKRIIDRVKAANPGIIVIMHSDGAVAPLIGDFIELGVEVYNPVQPNVPAPTPRSWRGSTADGSAFSEASTSRCSCRGATRRRYPPRSAGGRRFSAPAAATSSRRPISSQADVSVDTIEHMVEVVKTISTARGLSNPAPDGPRRLRTRGRPLVLDS